MHVVSRQLAASKSLCVWTLAKELAISVKDIFIGSPFSVIITDAKNIDEVWPKDARLKKKVKDMEDVYEKVGVARKRTRIAISRSWKGLLLRAQIMVYLNIAGSTYPTTERGQSSITSLQRLKQKLAEKQFDTSPPSARCQH
jgi:hypothetical protein